MLNFLKNLCYNHNRELAVKKKWFNYRPICLVFAFLLLGSIFAFYLDKSIVWTLIVAFAVLITFFIHGFIKHEWKYLIISMISFLLGATLFNFAIISFNKDIYTSTPDSVQARVYLVDKPDNHSIMLKADNVIIDDKESDRNIVIYVYDKKGLFKNLEIGSVIKFKPKTFFNNSLLKYETPSAKTYADDLRYTVAVDMEDIVYLHKDQTFAEIIKSEVKEKLTGGLTNENVEVAYSALFGEKEFLSDSTYDAFKLSGVAHLLAVSGLHVGIIAFILFKLLDLLKIKKWWRLLVVGIFLGFYCYLCGFSVSVVRATIMTLVLILSDITRREYDPFNSISLAGIIIFLTNPLCAYDAGFLMSFACVFGIAILYKAIKDALAYTKMGEKTADALALSLATSISLIFIMAFFFKNFNAISIISNMLLIPIFTVGFVLVFVISILAFIIPILTYCLIPINYIFEFITITANVLGNLAISNFVTVEINYLTIVGYMILLLFLGKLCTAKLKDKIVVTLPILAILICVIMI